MDRMTYICSDAYSSFLRNESNAYVGMIEAGFSWQGQEEDLRGQLLARLSFRAWRKEMQPKEVMASRRLGGWRRGARFFSEIDRKRSGQFTLGVWRHDSLRSMCELRGAALKGAEKWEFKRPPPRETLQNLNWRRRQRRELHKELNRREPSFETLKKRRLSEKYINHDAESNLTIEYFHINIELRSLFELMTFFFFDPIFRSSLVSENNKKICSGKGFRALDYWAYCRGFRRNYQCFATKNV